MRRKHRKNRRETRSADWFCVDCEEVFFDHQAGDRSGRCPFCASAVTVRLGKWIKAAPGIENRERLGAV